MEITVEYDLSVLTTPVDSGFCCFERVPSIMPELLNPLVDAVFNCQDVEASPLRKVYSSLHDIPFILLVPPTFALWYYDDRNTKFPLHELCHSPEFVSSHILTRYSGKDNKPIDTDLSRLRAVREAKFCTFNGKIINGLFSKQSLYTTDGFSFRSTRRILKYETLDHFQNYLQGSSTFILIYIDQPLIDTNRLLKCEDLDCFPNLTINTTPSTRSLANLSSAEVPPQRNPLLNSMIHAQYNWKFRAVFQNYRKEITQSESMLIPGFRKTIDKIYDGLDNSFHTIPTIRQLIQEYVEQNVYDDVWQVLINRNNAEGEKEKQSESSDIFRFISLDQLDTDFYKAKFSKFYLKDIVQLEKNISKATKSFENLSVTHTYVEKCRVLVETLQILSKPVKRVGGYQVPITADTLVSLFILLIKRTKMKNIRCHLYYLQNFHQDENSIKFGLLGYAISTLEAVICYLETIETDKERLDCIEKNDANLEEFLTLLTRSKCVSNEGLDLSKYSHNFRYRNGDGNSTLSLCIINFKNDIFFELLSENYESYFAFEDLLEDQTTEGTTLLMQSLQHSNHEITEYLTDIMLKNSTEEELYYYCGKRDKYKRNIGHYICGQQTLLQKIGKYIKWDSKDCTGQTPLCVIFRSYDQAFYDVMVETSFAIAVEWYSTVKNSKFCFRDHTDSKGNTLLHIIKCNISFLLQSPDVDINKVNSQGLSPLTNNAMYDRGENVEALLKDPRLIFSSFDFLKQYPNTKSAPILSHYCLDNEAPFRNIIASHFDFRISNKRSVVLTSRSKEDAQELIGSEAFELKNLKALFRLLLKQHPFTFFPLEELLDELSVVEKTASSRSLMKSSFCSKVLKKLTYCLDSMVEMELLPTAALQSVALLERHIAKEKVTVDEEKLKRRSKDKKMQPESIGTITTFLKYILESLLKLKGTIIELRKFSILSKLKSKDISESKNIVCTLGAEVSSKKIGRAMVRYSTIDNKFLGEQSFDLLVFQIHFFESCLSSIINSIDHLLHLKIPEWWKCYGQLLELSKEDPSVLARESDHKQTPNASNNVGTSTTDHTSGMGVLGTFIEGKRIKNQERTRAAISDLQRRLKLLDNEIDTNNTLVVIEYCIFINFQSKFIHSAMLEKWVKLNINLLKKSLLDSKEKTYSQRSGKK